MTEAQVLALINQFIIANGNNEITADVLRPILVAILSQPNDKVGELSDLDTVDQSNIVNAINEVVNASNNQFDIYSGVDDPNSNPPASYSIGDWYIRNGTSLYQYNGSTWVLLNDNEVLPRDMVFDKFTYTSPNNTFTTSDNIFTLFDVKINQGSNYDSYAIINNGNEVTIDSSVLFDGDEIKITYTK